MSGHTSDPFGVFLKRLRKRQHLTQQQLADALGVHRNTMGRWEEGSFLPESKALVLDLARHLHLDKQETRQLLDASLIVPTPLWSVPYPRNPFFTGRESLLATLHAHLGSGQSMALPQSYALYGLGGIGKTQLALEYAYRYALEYRAIFWINAETVEQVHTSLLRIAERLDVPEHNEADQQHVVAAVQRWLETHEEWLLIWDNLEDVDVLQYHLPASRQGAFLITTRRQALGTRAELVEIPPLSEEEGVLLLLRRARRQQGPLFPTAISRRKEMDTSVRANAITLVHLLDGLPLALDQAGAYLEETGCSLGDYLQRYQAYRPHILARRGADAGAHPASVATTLQLAVEQVERSHPAAADILRLCAFVQAEAIPEELFTAGASHLGPILGPVLTDPYQFDLLLAALRGASLITRHTESHTLTIHRLVQVVLWEEMEQQERDIWQRRAIRVLNATFPEIIPENWKQCERILPHLLACAAAMSDDASVPELAEVLRKTADYLRGRARFEQAGPLYQRALRIEEQLWGPDHPRMAAPLYGLALLLYEHGKYVQAEPLARRALCIWENVLPPEDPELARPLIGLAIIFLGQGNYAQAALLCQRALHLREQVLGHEHPLVTSPLTDLADAYNEQGKYAQAEPLYQRAIRIQAQTMNAEHPLVAYALYGLGRLYTRQGKDEQAEALYRRVLHIREQALGAEHPYLTEPLTGLAICAARQGKEEQAEMLYWQALRVGERTWGSKHPELTLPLLKLADLYTKQGKEEQAEALYQRVRCIWEQEVGIEHPLLAKALSGLATLAVRQEKEKEAEALYRCASGMQERLLGPDHPDTASTLHDLSALRVKQ